MSLLNESDDMKKLQQLPLEFLKCNRSSYQANPFLPTPIAAVGHDRNVFFAVVFFLLWSWVMYSIGNLSYLRSEMLIFQPTIFISISDKEEFMKEVLRDGKTRITEWFRWGGGISWDYSIQLTLIKYSHLKQFVQDCVQMVFEYFQRWRLYSLLGQPGPVFDHTHNSKGFSSVFRWEFMCFNLCLLPFSYYWGQLRKIPFISSLHIFIHSD